MVSIIETLMYRKKAPETAKYSVIVKNEIDTCAIEIKKFKNQKIKIINCKNKLTSKLNNQLKPVANETATPLCQIIIRNFKIRFYFSGRIS